MRGATGTRRPPEGGGLRLACARTSDGSWQAAARDDSLIGVGEVTPEMAALRAEIAMAARRSNVIDRTLEVVSIVEAVSAPLDIHPVVVGGMAAYFWTATDEFMTYDIDVVMDVPDELAEKLAELGFDRARDGRHWVLEGTEVFLEAPSSRLDPDAVVTEIRLQSGRVVRIVSRVDILLDRLDEFQATGHEVPAQQALALLAKRPRTVASYMRSPEQHSKASTLQADREDRAAHNRSMAPRSTRTTRQERTHPRWIQAAPAGEAARPGRGRVPAPHRHSRAAYRAFSVAL